jgi:putative heme-binding domain-containing protein
VQLLASSNVKFRVWLNGKQLYDRSEAARFQADSDRFNGTLQAGDNRLVVQLDAAQDSAEFHLRFRRRSSKAELEQLVQVSLARAGNVERGRALFFDQTKTQCSKCHRIGDQGERIGPELTGLGDRFARIHIVESILEPSRTVAPGFQTLAVVLRDGRLITGVKIAETAEAITLADNQGKQHALSKSEIEQQVVQPHSTMPDGLMKQLTPGEFADLIGFLVSQKRP